MSAFKSNRRNFLRTGGLLAPAALAAQTTQRGGVPKVKITAVKTYLLHHTLSRPFGVSVSVPLDKTRQTLLVKIETDAGLTGWGETSPMAGVKAAVDGHLGPLLI